MTIFVMRFTHISRKNSTFLRENCHQVADLPAASQGWDEWNERSEVFCSLLCPDDNCRDREEGVELPNPFHAICSLGPERTRISYFAKLTRSAYAAFFKKAAGTSPTPPTSTGNPGERSGGICLAFLRFSRETAHFQRNGPFPFSWCVQARRGMAGFRRQNQVPVQAPV